MTSVSTAAVTVPFMGTPFSFAHRREEDTCAAGATGRTASGLKGQ